MKLLIALIVIIVTLCLCDPTRASPSNRVKRQGWNWGDDDNSQQQQRPRPTNPPSSEAPPSTETASSTQSPEFVACTSGCVTTPEYNPVCASNGQTYENVGKMNCAIRCGLTTLVKVFNGNCTPPRQ